jgi:predicted RND superfamily exporter protein
VIERYLRVCQRSPKSLIAIASGFTVLLCFFSFGRLDFDSNRESLFKATQAEIDKKMDFERRFGSWQDLVLVVDGGAVSDREEAVHRLAEQLSSVPYVTEVRATVELPGLEKVGLYFLTKSELVEVDQALKDYSPLLRKMSKDGWYGFLEYVQIHQGEPSVPSQSRERLARVWEQAVDNRGAGDLESLFPRLDLPARSYYRDGPDRHLIFLHSNEPLTVQEKVKELSELLHFDGRVILTGQPLLQAEEKRDTLRDAITSTVLALVVVQLILIRGFRETARPRLAFFSLTYGLLWSVAWAAVSVGSLNIITINFLAITVGLGVDFSIHILARYSEERSHGSDSIAAMEKTMRTTGLENMVGALATSLAFWALVMTDFLAVQQLGLITGVGVPLCFLSVVSLLPPLLFWREQGHDAAPKEPLAGSVGALEAVERALRQKPGRWLAVMGVAVLVMLALGTRVRFDYNLLNMQSEDSEAVVYEREGGFNSLAAFVVADTPDQARELKEKLMALSGVSEVQTVAELLPEHVTQKRSLVASIVSQVGELEQPHFDPEQEPDWERMRLLTDSLRTGEKQADWIGRLRDSGPGPVEDIWKQMQAHLKEELTHMLVGLGQQDASLELTRWKKHSPDLLRLSNLDGKTLLSVRSKGSLWNRDVLVGFLDQIESVTDRGLGPPFLIRNYLEQLRESYFDAVRYAVLAIVVLLGLHFRSATPTLIALVPKVVGAIGMFAAMSLAGIDLNPANCMALPLTLGIGLVFGIHAVHRCLESPDALLVRGGTGKAIALSALTTIASFGTLMAASHPGIFSLGFVMASGVAANMLATFLLVPPLVVVFRKKL